MYIIFFKSIIIYAWKRTRINIHVICDTVDIVVIPVYKLLF